MNHKLGRLKPFHHPIDLQSSCSYAGYTLIIKEQVEVYSCTFSPGSWYNWEWFLDKTINSLIPEGHPYSYHVDELRLTLYRE